MSPSILSFTLVVTLISAVHALTIRDLSRLQHVSQHRMKSDTQHDMNMNMGGSPFATPFFMRIKGAKHNDVKGGVTEKGKEGLFAVYDVDHSVVTPYRVQEGGRVPELRERQHQPFKVKIDIDQATPILYDMWATNEILEIQLNHYKSLLTPSVGSAKKPSAILFQIKFIHANIVNIHNIGGQLEVSFVYQKIEWTWVDGGISAQDDLLIKNQ